MSFTGGPGTTSSWAAQATTSWLAPDVWPGRPQHHYSRFDDQAIPPRHPSPRASRPCRGTAAPADPSPVLETESFTGPRPSATSARFPAKGLIPEAANARAGIVRRLEQRREHYGQRSGVGED